MIVKKRSNGHCKKNMRIRITVKSGSVYLWSAFPFLGLFVFGVPCAFFDMLYNTYFVSVPSALFK